MNVYNVYKIRVDAKIAEDVFKAIDKVTEYIATLKYNDPPTGIGEVKILGADAIAENVLT